MALNKDQLSKTGNLNAVSGAPRSRQLWHYNSGADLIGAVDDAGYFNGVRGFLNVGDVILAVTDAGAKFRVLTVTAVPTTGDVTVSVASFA